MTKPTLTGPKYVLKSNFPHAAFILRSILGEYQQSGFGSPGVIAAMKSTISRMDAWTPGEELVTWLVECNSITARRLSWHASDHELRGFASAEQILELREAGRNFKKYLKENPAPIAEPIAAGDVDMDKNLYDDDLPCTCPSPDCKREALRAKQAAVRAAEDTQAVASLKIGTDEIPRWQREATERGKVKRAAREALAVTKGEAPEIVLSDVPGVGRVEIYDYRTVLADVVDLVRFVALYREQVDPESRSARVLLDDVAHIVNSLRLANAVRDVPGVPHFPAFSTRDESGVSMVFVG